MSSEDPKFGEKFDDPTVRNSEAYNPPTTAETFDRVGSAASEFNDSVATVEQPLHRPDSDIPDGFNNNAAEDDDSPLRWLVPLVLVLLMIVLGYWFCGKTTTTVSKISRQTVIAKTTVA